MHEDASQPRDTQCVWFFGIVGHEACPILLRTRVHTFFLSDPRKAASLMPCGDHNTYWAVAITGEGEDIKVRSGAPLAVLLPRATGTRATHPVWTTRPEPLHRWRRLPMFRIGVAALGPIRNDAPLKYADGAPPSLSLLIRSFTSFPASLRYRASSPRCFLNCTYLHPAGSHESQE